MKFLKRRWIKQARRDEHHRETKVEDGTLQPRLTIVQAEAQQTHAEPSQPSFFQSSSNVAITGGQFTSAGGHHTNLTINLNQGAVENKSGILSAVQSQPSSLLESNSYTNHVPGHPEPSAVKHSVNTEDQSQSLSRAVVPAPRLPPPPVQRSCDIYYRHLSVKEFGYPLWIPEPNNRLPMQYQTKGLSIGDVGIITPSGSFDFLFNICSSSSDPINPRELPEHFAPLHPPLDPIDTRYYMEFKPSSYLASASIEQSQREDGDSSGLAFESSASEGAILTMPDGAYSEDLGNISRFRKYLAANAERWYQYVNGIRGREAQNGDVRLVGCHKSTAWGVATFSNLSERKGFRLRFRPIGKGSIGLRTYGWDYSGTAEVRAGPSSEEIEHLRTASNGEPGSSTVYQNQCLFVRTLNVTLRDDIWKRLNSELEVDGVNAHDHHTNSSPNDAYHFSANRSGGSAPEPGSASRNNNASFGINYSSGSTFTEAVRIPDLPRSLTDHPSKAINEMLLREKPNAKMAITEDRDWISVLREDDTVLPDAEQLCKRIRAYRTVSEEDGIVFLYSGHEVSSENPQDAKSIATSENTWVNAHSNLTSHQSLLSGTTLESAEERGQDNDEVQLLQSLGLTRPIEVPSAIGKVRMDLKSSEPTQDDHASPRFSRLEARLDSIIDQQDEDSIQVIQRSNQSPPGPIFLDDEVATIASGTSMDSGMLKGRKLFKGDHSNVPAKQSAVRRMLKWYNKYITRNKRQARDLYETTQ